MLTRTTTALLDDLADPGNEEIWQQIDARYRPILVGFARRLGLGVEDAADAAQEALGDFARAYRAGKYERGRGRLSSWIIGIARNCVIDAMRVSSARRERRGLSAVGELPDDNGLETIWNEQRDREILRAAIDALREESRFDTRTINAFELLAIRQSSPASVAEQLEMSMNDVYLAKHRCLKRLRAIVSEMTILFERDA